MDFAKAASRIREGKWYICFEEPDEPMVWTDTLNGGEKRKNIPTPFCKRHPELGCGWFEVVEIH